METRHIGSGKGPSITISLEKLGLPGTRGEMHFVAQFPGDTRSDQIRLNDTSERQFKIFALLSKVPNPSDNISGNFSQNDSGSYLFLPEPATQANIATPWGNFRGLSPYRNAVAHFMRTDDSSVLHPSQPDHMDQYANIIPICELCVRKMIASHESLLKAIFG